jgi:hypothetical protein
MESRSYLFHRVGHCTKQAANICDVGIREEPWGNREEREEITMARNSWFTNESCPGNRDLFRNASLFRTNSRNGETPRWILRGKFSAWVQNGHGHVPDHQELLRFTWVHRES